FVICGVDRRLNLICRWFRRNDNRGCENGKQRTDVECSPHFTPPIWAAKFYLHPSRQEQAARKCAGGFAACRQNCNINSRSARFAPARNFRNACRGPAPLCVVDLPSVIRSSAFGSRGRRRTSQSLVWYEPAVLVATEVGRVPSKPVCTCSTKEFSWSRLPQ